MLLRLGDFCWISKISQDDIESLEAILSWRDEKARRLGLTDFDLRLVKLDKVVCIVNTLKIK